MKYLLFIAIALSSCWPEKRVLRIACVQNSEDTCCWTIAIPGNKFVKHADDLYWNDSLRYNIELETYNKALQSYMYNIYPYRRGHPIYKLVVDFKKCSVSVLDWNFNPVQLFDQSKIIPQHPILYYRWDKKNGPSLWCRDSIIGYDLKVYPQ